jgi:hypothetical protein
VQPVGEADRAIGWQMKLVDLMPVLGEGNIGPALKKSAEIHGGRERIKTLFDKLS